VEYKTWKELNTKLKLKSTSRAKYHTFPGKHTINVGNWTAKT